jgi:hypothetical protein
MANLDDFIEHHGIKGMRWGVIRNDVQLGNAGGGSKETTPKKAAAGGGSSKTSSASTKQLIDDFYKNKSPEELKAEGQRKLKAQADDVFPHSATGPKKSKKAGDEPEPTADELKSGGMSKNQKIALAAGATVAVGLLAYYGSQKLNQGDGATPPLAVPVPPAKPTKKQLSENHKAQTATLHAEMSAIFGEHDGKGLNGGPGPFYAGLMSKKAMDRPEFTLPKSTMFQRMSNHAETGDGYEKGAYVTFLTNDKNSYSGSGEFGGAKYNLQFQPTHDIKVPSVSTILKTLKEVGGPNGEKYNDKQAYAAYHSLSGGTWRKSAGGQKLIDGLKAKGYSAIVDDMDAGYLGDLPLVFFGETKQVNVTERNANDRFKDKANTVGPSMRYA